jgi:hypothetical protein
VARAGLLLTALLSITGCTRVGHTIRPAPAAAEAQTVDGYGPAVVWVVVEGLRRDALEDYLGRLRENELDPDWPSGLAVLAETGFRLATVPLAESPLPATRHSTLTTLVTGVYPGQHGVVGERWYTRGPGGALQRQALDEPAAALPIFPIRDPTAPGTLESIVRVPTLFERLAGQKTVVAAFLPIGRGAEWRTPDRADLAAALLLPGQGACAAIPLIDGGARAAALGVEAQPDLLVLYLAGVHLNGRTSGEARPCTRTTARAAQRVALRDIDAHLARVFDQLASRDPARWARTTVVLTGTAGAEDRDSAEHTERLALTDLANRLADHAPDGACASWLRRAPTGGALLMAPSSGAAHLYVPEAIGVAPAGAEPDGHRACLVASARALVRADDVLDAATWRTPEAAATSVPVVTTVRGVIRPALRSSMSARRRRRLLARMPRLFEGDDGRVGDVVVFSRAPWIFVDEVDAPFDDGLHRGGVGAGAVEHALLVASRHLDDATDAALRGMPVETAGVAPTLVALLEADDRLDPPLPRPPFLRWQPDSDTPVLDAVAADRSVAPTAAAASAGKRYAYRDGEALVVGYLEPASLASPDALELLVGAHYHPWQGFAGYAEGAPCVASDEDLIRRWSCRLPLPERDGVVTLGVRRSPPLDPSAEAPTWGITPLVSDSKSPSADVAGPRAVCADRASIRLRLGARDDLGLARVEIGLAPTGSLADRSILASGAGSAVLDPLPLECDEAGRCAYTPRAPDTETEVDLPFDADLIEAALEAERRHGRRAGRDAARSWLAAVRPDIDGEALRTTFIRVRICDLAGACVATPLMTDEDWRDMVEVGCEPAAPQSSEP